MLNATPHISIPREELSLSFVRSSGPGGQNVNKVSSKAQLRWNVAASPSLPDDVRRRLVAKLGRRLTASGEVVLTSQRYRDQHRNADDCLEKLAEMIRAAAVPPRKRRPTRPTRASQERRVKSKQSHGAKKRLRRTPLDDS
jgi:ribosome-associated protein